MFPQRLRAARKAKGLTQEELAKKIHTKKATISNYENGYSSPNNETLSLLADILMTSVDYLLGRTDDPSPANNPTITVAGQEIELTPEQYKVFQEMMKHPKFAIMFHDLATDTEKKVKQLIDTWEFIRKQIEQDDDEEFGEGFGELED